MKLGPGSNVAGIDKFCKNEKEVLFACGSNIIITEV
jgi:hypothetical protein